MFLSLESCISFAFYVRNFSHKIPRDSGFSNWEFRSYKHSGLLLRDWLIHSHNFQRLLYKLKSETHVREASSVRAFFYFDRLVRNPPNHTQCVDIQMCLSALCCRRPGNDRCNLRNGPPCCLGQSYSISKTYSHLFASSWMFCFIYFF